MGYFDISPNEIKNGSIIRTLFLLSTPILAQNIVHIAQQVVDLFWIGQYSNDAVAAIGLASPVVSFLLMSTMSATFVGTQILVAQRVGADNVFGARSAAFSGMLLTMVLGIIVGIIMFFNVENLINLVTSTRPESIGGEISELSIQYLKIISLGVVLAGMSDVIEATFLGWGESRAALYMNVLTVVGNIGLDPIFIFGWGPIPEMGIQGAALATVFGYGFGFLLGVLLAVRGWAGGIYSSDAIRLEVKECRELLSIGLPRAVQGIANTSGKLLIVLIAFTASGSPGLVAYTVGSRVGAIASRVSSSVSQAAQSIVAQNMGADNPKRATDTITTGILFTVLILLVFGVFQLGMPKKITHILVPEINGQSLSYSILYLKLIVLTYPSQAVMALIKAGFNGAKQTKVTMVASLIQKWGFYIPLATIAGIRLGHGVSGVFWADTISVIVASVVFSMYYYKSSKKMYR